MLLADFLKTEQQERIAILISYGEKEQLPRVPAADSSTGEEQAVAVYECLQISTPQHPTQEGSSHNFGANVG